MTKTGTIDYLCFIPFNFEDPIFVEFDTLVLDSGMGIESDDIFKYTIDILLETYTLYDLIDQLDRSLFPEHVPNDAVNGCVALCMTYITHVMAHMNQYKKDLNILVVQPVTVILNRKTSSVELMFTV